MCYEMTASIGGSAVRLPVAPRRGVPFDVDLGPDGSGGVTAVHSRCATEPTEAIASRSGVKVPLLAGPTPVYAAGRGCDLYRYDFSTGRERRVAGASTTAASEVLPAIWRDTIAFVRVYDRRSGRRGRLPYVYVRSLSTGRTARRRGGLRGLYGLPGPTSTDLYGHTLVRVELGAQERPHLRPRDQRGARRRGDRRELAARRADPGRTGVAVVRRAERQRSAHLLRARAHPRQLGRHRTQHRPRALRLRPAHPRDHAQRGLPMAPIASLAVDDATAIYGTAGERWNAADSEAAVLAAQG